ncbi:MAG: hypothetical protein DMG07_27605 [Acidobacteria bacterium]|nr:MAG: hypothetical protein DMG07_27605 [Acidobacteriota bacterium]
MADRVTRRQFERWVGLSMVGSRALPQAANALAPVGSSSDASQAKDTRPIEAQEAALKPWADVFARRWANASKARITMDMGRCEPASALSSRPEPGHWKVIPYELTDGAKGNLLWAAADQGAPPLRLRLGVKGWHAVFVGLYATVLGPSTVWLRLDGDVAAQPRTTAEHSPYGSFTEVFFKVAELNDTTLHIEQQSAGAASAAGIVYVKLIPSSEEESAGFVADRDQRETRRLAVTNDGGFLGSRAPTTVEEVLRELEVFRDTDFGTLLLHVAYGDTVNYASPYGYMIAKEMDGLIYPDSSYKNYGAAVRALDQKGINAMKVMVDGAHAMGMKVHVGIRPALWTYYEPLRDFFDSPFYQAHAEWRCVDRDGTAVARMSWAVPEVRKHVIDVLREAVGFGGDGAHLVFCRGVPVVLYEPPFVELFQKKYGADPSRPGRA